jgi:hypothetical protein
LPARKTERITLQYPRPDVSVAVDPNTLTTGDQYIISTEQNTSIPETDGNNNPLQLQP